MAIKATYQEYIDLKDIITKVEGKLEMETKLVIEINTLLDTISIAL